MSDFTATHRETYLRTGGTQGHILDLTGVGGHSLTTHCLIRVTGRKSGRTQIVALIYGDISGEVVIVASKGGADHHPEWYLNLRAAPEVDFQIATQAFRATWREPEGDERHRIWDFMSRAYPPYINYQKSTQRHIPLIMMTPVAPIEVFSPGDVGR
jgi:deazaflavin-dependent oxidoreductase (nitroreductase family)